MLFSKLSQNIIKTNSSKHRESKSVEGLISSSSPSSIAQGKLKKDGNLRDPYKNTKINGNYADSKRYLKIPENSSGVNSIDELDGWNYGQLQEQQQQIQPYQQPQSYMKDPPGTFSGLRIVTSNKFDQANNNNNESRNQISNNSSSLSSQSSLSSSQIGVNNESAIYLRKKPTIHSKQEIEKDKITNRQKQNNSKEKINGSGNSSKSKNKDIDDRSSKSKLLLLLQPPKLQQQIPTKPKEIQSDKSKEGKTDRKINDKSVEKYSNRSNKTPVLASEGLHSSRLCTPEKMHPIQNSSKNGFTKNNNNNNNSSSSSSYRSRSSSLFVMKNDRQHSNVPCHPLKQPIFENSLENKNRFEISEISNSYKNVADKKDGQYYQQKPLRSNNQQKHDDNNENQNVSPYEVFFQGEKKIQSTYVPQQSLSLLQQNHKVSEMRLKRIREQNNVSNSRVLNCSESMVDEKSGMLKDQAKRRILQIIQRQNGQQSENESEKDTPSNHPMKIKHHQLAENSTENQENIGCEEQENEIKGYIKGLMKVLKKISSAKKTNPKIEGSNPQQYTQVSTSKIKMASILHSSKIDQLSLIRHESPSKKQYDPVNYSYPDALNFEIKQLSEKKLSSKKNTPLKNGLAFSMQDKQIEGIINNNYNKYNQQQENVLFENSQNTNQKLRLNNENTTSKKHVLHNLSPANESDLKFYAKPSSRSANSDKQQQFSLRKHIFDNKTVNRQGDSVQKQEGIGYYDFEGQGGLQVFKQQQNNDKINQNQPILLRKRNASINSRTSRSSSINVNNPTSSKDVLSQPQEIHQNLHNIQPNIEKVILDKLNRKHKRSVSAYRVQKVQPVATQRERSVSTKNQHGQGYLRNNPVVETVVSKDTILSRDMQNEGLVRVHRGSRSVIKILNPYKSAEKLASKGQRKINHNRCTSEPRGISLQRDDEQQQQQGFVWRQRLQEQEQNSIGVGEQGQDQQEGGKSQRKSSVVGVSNFRERRAQMKSASSACESNKKLKHQYWMDILISSGNTPEKQHNIEESEEQRREKETKEEEEVEGNKKVQEDSKQEKEDIRRKTPERQVLKIESNNNEAPNIPILSLSPIGYVENHRTSLSNMEATHKSIEVPYENFDRFPTSMFSEETQLQKEDKQQQQQQQWMRQSQVEKENNEKEALIQELSQIIRQEPRDQQRRNDNQARKVISSQNIVFFDQMLKAGGSKPKLFGEESQLSGIAGKKERLRSRNSFCSSDVALRDYLHIDHKSQMRAPSVGLDAGGGEQVQKSQFFQEPLMPLQGQQIPQIKPARQQQRVPTNSMLFLRSGANIVKPPSFQRIFVSPEQRIFKRNNQSIASLESKDDERILDLLLLDTLELKDKLSVDETQQQKQLQNKQL